MVTFDRKPREASPPPHMQEVSVGSLKKLKAKVAHVHFEGLGRTKNDILVDQVKQVFKAETVFDMFIATMEAKGKMEQLGLFKSGVNIHIDTAKGGESGTAGYDITFTVKELRRFRGRTDTMFGTNSSTLTLGVEMPNTFGRAERLSGRYTYGIKDATGFEANFAKPLQGNPNLILQSLLYQHSREFPWSGYNEISKGIGANLTFPTALGSHRVSWEGVWRELGCHSNAVPFAVREQAGHSVKSAIQHILVRDQRDSSVLPSTGTLLKSTQELAGVGGDVDYMKQDLQLQYNAKLFQDAVLQLSLAGGIMRAIKPTSHIRLQDRFFLGSPLTLRGFNLRGCGPHTEGSAMGANAYWLAAAHIYTPLPFQRGKTGFIDKFRTHLFVNAGNLTNVDFADHWKQNLVNIAESLRWSYGAGLVFNLMGKARIELNYCVPVKAAPTDSVNHGLQFGLGIEFL